MSKRKDLTVFILRGSPFHNGHANVLSRALLTSKAVLVLIGSAGQARTTKNPFTFAEREVMIEDWYDVWRSKQSPQTNLIIKPLYDHPYNDNAWIRGVQDAVDETKVDLADHIGINPSVYLTGADRDKSTWYLHTFGNLFIPDFLERTPSFELSATKVRELMFSDKSSLEEIAKVVPATTLSFLVDFMDGTLYDDGGEKFNTLVKEYQFIEKYKAEWAKAPYPPIFSTVDTCVIQSGHVLVNVRDNFPGVGLWCLPGGFLEQNEKLVDGAIRELTEETNIELSRAQLYGAIRSKEIFDHPDRSLRGRTITTCYLLKLDDSKPLPKIKPQKGEVKKTMWVPIAEALKRSDAWFEDHYHITRTMYGRIHT